MARAPARQTLRDRAAKVRAAGRDRGRALCAALDARPVPRVVAGLVFAVAAPAVVALLRVDIAAAGVAARAAAAFCLLAWLGRGLRLAWQRRSGPSPFGVWREPAWDGVLGWLFATASLLVVSLLWKRAVGSAEPLGLTIPILCAGIAAALSLPKAARGADGQSQVAIAPTRREFVRLAGLLSGFAFLAAGHLGVRRPYSSDPEQHVAWLQQLRLYGFVPDLYWQTDAPITYPMGFASLSHAFGAFSGLPASDVIALLPPLVSAVFVYLVVAAARELASQGEPRRGDGVLFGLAFLACASAFESAQFSAWNVYEGTGRLAAGLLHLVPVLALLAAASSAVASASSAPAATWRGGLLPFGWLVTSALVWLLNPAHLPLHTLAWIAAIGLALWRARKFAAGAWRGAVAGCAAGAAVALMLLAADGATARRVLGLGEVDPRLARVEAEFDARFAGQTCTSPACLVQAAARPDVLVAAAKPARVLVEGPVRALVQPGYDRWSQPMVRGPRSFPDLTATGLAPLHGWARWLCIPLPLLLAVLAVRARKRRMAWLVALVAVLAWASVDAAARAAIGGAVDPDDARLRLLPAYVDRASAVLFAQTFWPLLVAGIVVSAVGTRARAVAAVALLAAIVSAQSELAGRRGELERWRRGPGAGDLADLYALEAEHMPAGEHYLVSSHIVVSNREQWLLPIDPSSPLYVQAQRPALFLYHLSSGALVTAADFEATCRVVGPGAPSPTMAVHRARWVALRADEATLARAAFVTRRFCGRNLGALFPHAELAGFRGRVALFRLWE